jgi:transcriptional regulator with XRE-family HTH domain
MAKAKSKKIKAINSPLGIKSKGRKTKQDAEAVKRYGFILYMQNVQQTDIAERCNVTPATITEWKQSGNWEAKRAAKSISMDELIAKALTKINELLDSKDFNADAFAKAVAQLKTLKHRNTVDDEIMCFMDFQNFLIEKRFAEGIDESFIKKLTRLQDQYIQLKLGNV